MINKLLILVLGIPSVVFFTGCEMTTEEVYYVEPPVHHYHPLPPEHYTKQSHYYGDNINHHGRKAIVRRPAADQHGKITNYHSRIVANPPRIHEKNRHGRNESIRPAPVDHYGKIAHSHRKVVINKTKNKHTHSHTTNRATPATVPITQLPHRIQGKILSDLTHIKAQKNHQKRAQRKKEKQKSNERSRSNSHMHMFAQNF